MYLASTDTTLQYIGFCMIFFGDKVKSCGRAVTQNESECNRTKGTAEREGGKPTAGMRDKIDRQTTRDAGKSEG